MSGYLDKEKPELKAGEVLCGGCWKVEMRLRADSGGWKFYSFKHLESQWLCPDCIKREGPNLDKLQEYQL